MPYASAGSQGFVVTPLPEKLATLVKVPTVRYPIGNTLSYATARMDVRELAQLVNELAAVAGTIPVTSLPAVGIVGVPYLLKVADTGAETGVKAPAGIYYYNSIGWVCSVCLDAYEDSITGNVVRNYVPGAIYRVTIIGAPTAFHVHLTAVGATQLLLINPDGHNVSTALTTFISGNAEVYARSSEGIASVDSPLVEIQIANTGYEEIWSCIDLNKMDGGGLT